MMRRDAVTIGFPETNAVLVGTADVLPLPVMRDDMGGTTVTSCWQMSVHARLRLLFGGRVWLTVRGCTQAPMWMTAFNPVAKEDSP